MLNHAVGTIWHAFGVRCGTSRGRNAGSAVGALTPSTASNWRFDLLNLHTA